MAISSGKTVQSIIKERRKALKLSQTDLGKRLGISRRSYQNCETGRMTTEQMQDICRDLNLTILILPSEHII
jgi:DNA-binding XRE family transcriptional regulator